MKFHNTKRKSVHRRKYIL